MISSLLNSIQFFVFRSTVNLKDLEEYNNATHFEEKKHEFQNELNQNLELWDNLMKVRETNY